MKNHVAMGVVRSFTAQDINLSTLSMQSPVIRVTEIKNANFNIYVGGPATKVQTTYLEGKDAGPIPDYCLFVERKKEGQKLKEGVIPSIKCGIAPGSPPKDFLPE